MRSIETVTEKLVCFHCGESCSSGNIRLSEKVFCCEGCKMVYGILNEHSLCDYYELNKNPGINQRMKFRQDKFAFLDDDNIAAKIITFKDEKQVRVTFYLPQMHCSSCLYLLENLYRLNDGIISSKVNFARKEVDIVFLVNKTSIRVVAENLTAIGYEPYISLNDLKERRPGINKSLIYQVGVAGFCFGNIMLMSFPEYLGIDASEVGLRSIFRWLNFVLATPVLLYSALPFYQSAWKSLRHRFLNIDAPIALAVIITFIRSAWEVITGTGGGYFDSMTGIVLFMLAGRILQDKTYRQLSFERDYTSYFPIAVSVIRNNIEVPTSLPDIKPGDTLLIHSEELVPVDGILTKGKGFIDYSFVTGESMPLLKQTGELIYAGGKQTEGNIELLVIKEVTQSYLTSLWNKDELKSPETRRVSFVHILSRYFTYVVMGIALVAAIYWLNHDQSKLWPAVTSVFIIACPCALLLSNSFTNGNILRILSHNQFYLRDAPTIEKIASIDHIVFDKTGTLTHSNQHEISFKGKELSGNNRQQIAALANCSGHPLSRSLAKYLKGERIPQTSYIKESIGSGIEGIVEDELVKIGSYEFITGRKNVAKGTRVYIKIGTELKGYFLFTNHYRQNVQQLMNQLASKYELSILSGDNDSERQNLVSMIGQKASLRFGQRPEDKLSYIKSLQEKGKRVMMIGDGLNDAGALKQSDVGVALADQSNNFTPACDAIMDGTKLHLIGRFINICKANKRIVIASFVLSIVYNCIGLFFAVQGLLSPLVAAILMPSSSLSILLLTFGSSNLAARRLKL